MNADEKTAYEFGLAVARAFGEGLLAEHRDKESAEVTRLQRIQGEAESETTRLREEATKWQKIVMEAESRNAQQQRHHDEVQLKLEKAESRLAELEPRIANLEKLEKQYASRSLHIIGNAGD